MKINIGENIKKLRAEKQVTQEQLAEHLSISYQAVSKWENNVTTPDIFLLPAIAEYFEVPIDELFKVNMRGYKNKAERLCSIYEADTGKKENFDKADAEYEKLFAENKADHEDMRSYGILNEYRSRALAKKAEDLYRQAIAAGNKDTKSQLMYLLSRTSRNEENITNQEEALKNEPDDLSNWQLLADAYEYARMYEQAFEVIQKGLEKFPNDAGLLNRCGLLCMEFKKYGEAVDYYKKAIEKNPNMGNSYYGIARAYKASGKYKEAIEAWEQAINLHEKKGFDVETEYPKQEIAKLRELLQE